LPLPSSAVTVSVIELPAALVAGALTRKLAGRAVMLALPLMVLCAVSVTLIDSVVTVLNVTGKPCVP
jgi:hypothetical protein